MAKDYYKILGVERNAGSDAIKRAYRKLARKHHPDLNRGNSRAEEQFKLVQEAYDVLSDPQKKAQFDRFGDAFGHPQAPGQPGGASAPFVDLDGAGIHFEDLLEKMFGARAGRGGAGAGPRSAAPAEDIEFNLDISLEGAYHGGSQRFQVTVEDVCPECGGLGQKRSGRGHLDLNVCTRCHGHGRLEALRTGQVNVPAGAWDGMRSRLSGIGPADSHGKRGDLYVRLHVLKHPRFERDGQNLQFDVPVPYTVAALGGEVEVEMLDGRTRQLMVPPGVQSGQKLRLAGQGMPALRDRPAGDAFARIRITVPPNLSERERDLLTQLARMRRDPIRPVEKTAART